MIPAGPLAIAVIRGILPYRTLDTPAATAAKIAAHQDTESLATWLIFAALLTLIPGVIAAGLAARRAAPRLGTTGLVLSYAALTGLLWAISPTDEHATARLATSRRRLPAGAAAPARAARSSTCGIRARPTRTAATSRR